MYRALKNLPLEHTPDGRKHVPTPDPENSWPDLGAMLEWATEQGLVVDLGIINPGFWVPVCFDYEEGGSKLYADRLLKGNECAWPNLRRALTECVLEVWEKKGEADEAE